MKEVSKSRSIIIGSIICCLLIIIDQATKLMAVKFLKDGEPFELIKNVFVLRYLENNGAAFSLLAGKQIFFLIITIILILVFGFIFVKLPMTDRMKYLRYICVFLEAGAIGNLIDRIRLNYVIDFFYIKLINFPTFNVADIYITVSMFIFILLIMFYYKEEEFESFIKG
ncbi:MAG: signal peptidase II [Lachnospiraceae bacterium]|nr:signal peptidase II [Lachnospiraceae bacterium]